MELFMFQKLYQQDEFVANKISSVLLSENYYNIIFCWEIYSFFYNISHIQQKFASDPTQIQSLCGVMTEPSTKTNKLIYNVLDRNAKKIATLVKIANLNIQIEENHDESSNPHILQTPSGQLHKEYEIIYYVISQARDLSVITQANPLKKQPEMAKEESEEARSQVQGKISQNEIKQEIIINLQANDSFITAKMYEKLYELRVTLFPLLHEFYKYLTGNEKTKKSKYDSLMNKIKKQLGVLDADINQHPQIYHGQFNFLNIIIACEILMACKFVFEEKFRKSKYSLFNKYEKISHRQQFMEIHGKPQLCQKQYVPSEFEEDGGAQINIKESIIPTEIIKMSNNILSAQPDPARNQLLYNYFRSVFSQNQSKKPYFPYFWLMFDELNCCLIQIVQNVLQSEQQTGTGKLKVLQKKIMHDINPEIDYGIVGLYRSEKQKITVIRGLVCLGSKSADQFQTNFNKQEPIDVKFHRVDTSNQKEKKEVEKIWQNVEQKSVENDIKVVMILYI